MSFTADIAVAIAFVIFVALVLWKGTARITALLDRRSAEIARQLEEAQKLREDAQTVLATYRRRQRDAETEAGEIVAQAQAEAERLRVQAEEAVTAMLERRERQALDRIAQAEARALQDVRSMAVDLAVDAAGHLIRETMTPETRTRLIDDAIEELPDRLQ
ncbi:MAG: F0F1 ATP synthase subunit B [Alphaproteobacteria bacterium]|nr:F0F1 ATP synthase subunit B [Alphaproteobacteria bacterium]